MSPVIHTKNGFSFLRLLSLLAYLTLFISLGYSFSSPNNMQTGLSISVVAFILLFILKVIRWLFRD